MNPETLQEAWRVQKEVNMNEQMNRFMDGLGQKRVRQSLVLSLCILNAGGALSALVRASSSETTPPLLILWLVFSSGLLGLLLWHKKNQERALQKAQSVRDCAVHGLKQVETEIRHLRLLGIGACFVLPLIAVALWPSHDSAQARSVLQISAGLIAVNAGVLRLRYTRRLRPAREQLQKIIEELS